jgi:type III restriction enzyme
MMSKHLEYLYEIENPKVDTILNRINNRLSLRDPLRDSLRLMAFLAEELELKKDVDLDSELAKVKAHYPSCKNFERDFVSLCFSIATGVGKTRLMGAFITYLYLKKGVRNFFVLSPNLTIYDKLIEDFGNPNHPKYVFKGISEFVTNRPVIINGDNYAQQGQLYKDQEVRINIFNIAKFNSDNKIGRGKAEAGKPPKIKRLAEYLGQSYWEYLCGLDDLVVLMDEAHRYHADASKKALNELKPILGLELTATPIDEKGKAFKNVVYEYNLAQALEDGKYVKSPAVATRKDFNEKKNLTPKEIEQFKLEDAISVHEDTKVELELYAKSNNVPLVKPFILVVCKDINHATEVFEYMSSNAFYKGQFEGKVLQIDSSTKKVEEIEKQFLSLESPENEIEIVIHVNMLKEGWDVTNLYTIVPLRAANASVLIEQTIGRGLRLPYNGKRTGVDKVDKLTVLAHDNFNKVIQEAKNPDSVLNKLTYVELDEEAFKTPSVVITSETKVNAEVKREQAKIAQVQNPQRKQELTHALEAKKAIVNAIPTFSSSDGVNSVKDLAKPEIKKRAIEKIKQEFSKGQQNIFTPQIIAAAIEQYDAVVENFQTQIIEIPRMDLVLEEVETWFEDFELDTSTGFELNAMKEEIMRQELKDQSNVDTLGVRQGAFVNETPVNQVIAELINYSDVDYDESADLLNKLVTQALDKLKSNSSEEELPVLVRQYRKLIASRIYEQLKKNFKMSNPDYVPPTILPFVKIEDWNFTVPKEDGYRHYTDVIQPLSLVPKYVYRGFEKACHYEYKFDSNTEKDFSFVIEQDKSVLKWLRPASNQFRIYWSTTGQKYEPDFVVETEDSIFMCEPKKAKEVDTEEVQLKMKAALNYCHYANEFTSKNGGKKWRYLLIPHDKVDKTSSFEGLVNRFEKLKK